MKKTAMQTTVKEPATIRQLPRKYYDTRRTMSFLNQAKRFYANRNKRYEVQLEVIITLPYRVTATSSQKATDIVQSLWENGKVLLSTADIACVSITTFHNGTKEKDVVL